MVVSTIVPLSVEKQRAIGQANSEPHGGRDPGVFKAKCQAPGLSRASKVKRPAHSAGNPEDPV